MKERAPPAGLDPEALLVALVLDPATYSRNRFFQLYKDAEARRVRRRAALVRSVVRQLAAAGTVSLESIEVAASGLADLAYEIPALGLRRTTRLDALELALVRFALARAGGGSPVRDDDRNRIETVLARLAQKLVPNGPDAQEAGNQFMSKA